MVLDTKDNGRTERDMALEDMYTKMAMSTKDNSMKEISRDMVCIHMVMEKYILDNGIKMRSMAKGRECGLMGQFRKVNGLKVRGTMQRLNNVHKHCFQKRNWFSVFLNILVRMRSRNLL